MTKLVATRFAEHNVMLHHSNEVPDPCEMTFFFCGLRHTVSRNEGEDSQAFWIRMLGVIGCARRALQQDKQRGNDYNKEVHVYAGQLDEPSLETLQRYHLKQHMLNSLGEIAASRSTKRGAATARVAALKLMGQLSGIVPATKHRKVEDVLPEGTPAGAYLPPMQFAEPPRVFPVPPAPPAYTGPLPPAVMPR